MKKSATMTASPGPNQLRVWRQVPGEMAGMVMIMSAQTSLRSADDHQVAGCRAEVDTAVRGETVVSIDDGRDRQSSYFTVCK